MQTGRAAPARPGDHAADALAGLEQVWERGIAEVEVRRGTDASTRLTNRRGTESLSSDDEVEHLRLHFVDLAILADELAGFGPEVLVLAPADLRAAVIERLERTSTEHAEAHGG